MLILDDARDYISSNMEHNGVLGKLFRRHRHFRIDIMIIVHGFDDLPPNLWKYVKYFHVGYLTAIPTRKDLGRVSNPKRLIEICKEVKGRLDTHRNKGGDIRGYFYCYKN